MTDFRHKIHMHLSQNMAAFTRDRIVVDAEGEVLPWFCGNEDQVMSEIGRQIFERGINFDKDCDSTHWLNFSEVAPIIAHMTHTSIVCYASTPQGFLSTTICH